MGWKRGVAFFFLLPLTFGSMHTHTHKHTGNRSSFLWWPDMLGSRNTLFLCQVFLNGPLEKAPLQIREREGERERSNSLHSLSPIRHPWEVNRSGRNRGVETEESWSLRCKEHLWKPGPRLQGMCQAGLCPRWAFTGPGQALSSCPLALVKRSGHHASRDDAHLAYLPREDVPILSSYSQAKLTLVSRNHSLCRKPHCTRILHNCPEESEGLRDLTPQIIEPLSSIVTAGLNFIL